MRRVAPLLLVPFVLAGCFSLRVGEGGPLASDAGASPTPSLSAAPPTSLTPPSASASPSVSPAVPASVPPSASASPSPSLAPAAESPSPEAASPVALPSSSPSSPPSPSPDTPASPSAFVSPSAPAASPSPSAATSPAIARFDPEATKLDLDRVASDLDSPVYVTGDGTGGGRLYIVERGGTIRVWEDGEVRRRPFLDISQRVDTKGERGLHAVAFHPGFAENARFLVHYNDSQGRTRIVEYRAREDGDVPAGSGRDVLTVEQPFANHNGGWIGFGPDGYLYVALGDGGGPPREGPPATGRDRGSLLGKILRIDIDDGRRYGIPKDNPFARGQKGFARETFAWGLRNPWRASFDRLSGDLWIGDVGEDRAEEVDRVPAGRSGLDFGWSDMEGNRCFLLADCRPRDYTAPVEVYGHDPECSIVGGYVYRGTDHPDLVGAYLYADNCSGAVWGLDADAVRDGRRARPARLLERREPWVSFGEDDAGELYLVSLDGDVFRVGIAADG